MTLRILFAVGMVSLLPWQALAADVISPEKLPVADGKETHGRGEEYWKKMDADKDGVINKQEWMASSEERFKEFDTSADGKISQEELQARREKMRERFKEMRAHRKEMMQQKPEQK